MNACLFFFYADGVRYHPSVSQMWRPNCTISVNIVPLAKTTAGQAKLALELWVHTRGCLSPRNCYAQDTKENKRRTHTFQNEYTALAKRQQMVETQEAQCECCRFRCLDSTTKAPRETRCTASAVRCYPGYLCCVELSFSMNLQKWLVDHDTDAIFQKSGELLTRGFTSVTFGRAIPFTPSHPLFPLFV